jgi:hypothetical protein
VLGADPRVFVLVPRGFVLGGRLMQTVWRRRLRPAGRCGAESTTPHRAPSTCRLGTRRGSVEARSIYIWSSIYLYTPIYLGQGTPSSAKLCSTPKPVNRYVSSRLGRCSGCPELSCGAVSTQVKRQLAMETFPPAPPSTTGACRAHTHIHMQTRATAWLAAAQGART